MRLGTPLRSIGRKGCTYVALAMKYEQDALVP